jgi:hypothetical protein
VVIFPTFKGKDIKRFPFSWGPRKTCHALTVSAFYIRNWDNEQIPRKQSYIHWVRTVPVVGCDIAEL